MSKNWLCPKCKTLLGIQKGPRLEIRYKTACYIITRADAVEAICRRCGRKVSVSNFGTDDFRSVPD